nr:rubrerythrin-like domain-containing protein [Haloferax massiliensis]
MGRPQLVGETIPSWKSQRSAYKPASCLRGSVADPQRRNPRALAQRGCQECRSCRTRTVSETHLSECPDCGGSVRNIAVARE